jgi:beta-mannosidase
MRMAVEGWRRNRGRCSGALYWQLNDCWPVASWSSIDYFGRWKALQYAARRFFDPLLLSIEDRDGSALIFLTNDRTEEWQGEVRWSLENLDGAVLSSGVEQANASLLGTTLIKTLDINGSPEALRQTVLVAELWQNEEQLASQVHPFTPDKHLPLSDPQLGAEIRFTGGLLHINITAHSLARFIELSLDGADTIFSDNCFDLPAGRSVVVTCPLPAGWEAAQTAEALRIRSIYQSYA